jgi:integrase
MIEEEIPSFAELTPDQCARYASHVSKTNRSSTIMGLLGIITSYYDLNDQLVDRLPQYPWSPRYGARTDMARGGLMPYGTKFFHATTEVIPFRILSELVRAALDYIENRSGPMLDLRERIEASARRKYTLVEEVHRARHPTTFASGYSNERAYIQKKAVHRSTGEDYRLLEQHGYVSRRAFRQDMTRLRTACYIICAAFSGMRDSELASLNVDCFIKKRGFGGDLFYWLKGTTYKLEHEPRATEWMVPEIVGKAVKVAIRLSARDRERCVARVKELEHDLRSRRLSLEDRLAAHAQLEHAKQSVNSLFMASRQSCDTSTLGRGQGTKCLKEFGKSVGIVVEQSDMDGVFKRDKIRVGRPWPFTPHEFRRSFAVYVARHDLGDVRFLREHFKHWSLDMTLYYTRHESDVDQSLFSDILTERDELQAMLIQSWMSPDTLLAGKGGHRIMTFRGRGEVKHARDMPEFCRKLGENVFIRGTGHSWCMASGNSCGGEGLYDALRCTSCGEAVIDVTHRNIWEGIRQQQVDVLRCSDLGAPAKQRCIDHLRKAESVLTDLGAPVSPMILPAEDCDECK